MLITKDDVGRKVFSVIEGWGEIKRFDSSSKWKVKVHFCNEKEDCYLHCGRAFARDKFSELRWQEVKITDPEKPEPERVATITEKNFEEMVREIWVSTMDGKKFSVECSKFKEKLFGTPEGEG